VFARASGPWLLSWSSWGRRLKRRWSAACLQTTRLSYGACFVLVLPAWRALSPPPVSSLRAPHQDGQGDCGPAGGLVAGEGAAARCWGGGHCPSRRLRARAAHKGGETRRRKVARGRHPQVCVLCRTSLPSRVSAAPSPPQRSFLALDLPLSPLAPASTAATEALVELTEQLEVQIGA
jgi:hypothetical protein